MEGFFNLLISTSDSSIRLYSIFPRVCLPSPRERTILHPPSPIVHRPSLTSYNTYASYVDTPSSPFCHSFPSFPSRTRRRSPQRRRRQPRPPTMWKMASSKGDDQDGLCARKRKKVDGGGRGGARGDAGGVTGGNGGYSALSGGWYCRRRDECRCRLLLHDSYSR